MMMVGGENGDSDGDKRTRGKEGGREREGKWGETKGEEREEVGGKGRVSGRVWKSAFTFKFA